METTAATKQQESLTTKGLFAREDVQKKFKEMLGDRAAQFITSVLQIAASNDMLSKADSMSIYNAAATAATLDLPLNANLGFAYIIPYNITQQDGTKKVVAQFQIGAKGFKQLALRTGQFLNINTTDVREGEIQHRDRLSGEITFDWIQDEAVRLQKPIVGYVSFFKLINGYSQTFFMTIEKIREHGSRYSKTYKSQYGLWNTDFDAMAQKTVMKLNLSKNAPLSVEMRKAIVSDGAMIKDAETEDVEYVDGEQAMLTEKKSVLNSKTDQKIEVKTPVTDSINKEAPQVSPEIQPKGKKKEGELPL